MLLRDYKPADLNTLHAIDTACFPPGISYTLEELRAFITHQKSKTWVAEEGEKIAGFLVAHKAAAKVAEAHIVTLDVAEEARRRGVGTLLMDAAEEWARARGCKCISLETAEDNRAAQAFYQKRGYEKTEMIENYYENGTSAWVMAKRVG
ncbi:MAG: GNAT family N-acetyltransferase [Terriglobia bacterium]